MDVLADTNILLRRLQRSHPQHREAREAITKLIRNGDRACVLSQNLIELWAVCTRPVGNNGFGLTPDLTERVLGRVETLVFRLPDDDKVYPEWRRLVAAYGVSGKKTHDARLVAGMMVHGIKRILTFNTADFTRYAGIDVLHPAKLRTDVFPRRRTWICVG